MRIGGWRGLILFWGFSAFAVTAGAGVLQWAGPVSSARPAAKAAVALPPHTSSEHPGVTPELATVASEKPGRTVPGPIADVDPALLEPGRTVADNLLPRIATDGRISGRVYAGAFTPTRGRPRIAIILVGFGLSTEADQDAIASLPPGITLAISPYAPGHPASLQAARTAGHELLLSIPMEPQGFPLNDPGAHALLSTASPDENHANLLWVLGRSMGYAGTIGALGPRLFGERFSQLGEPMNRMLAELASRGLFYVDARVAPGGEAPPLPAAWSRATDRIIDDPPGRAGIDASLTELEHVATDRGVAVGLVGVMTPVVLDRLKAWSRGLGERGIELAPASAVMQAPPDAKLATAHE